MNVKVTQEVRDAAIPIGYGFVSLMPANECIDHPHLVVFDADGIPDKNVGIVVLPKSWGQPLTTGVVK